ncbi:MAG: hypothetical protein LBP52_05395 [Burkholderiaceae bacterium]|jgi:hypothetical protein|nr:hypothetical protein [Burkholderiaceae bacterium]
MMQRFFDWLAADTVFPRSCVFIVGGCIFFGIAWAVFRNWPPPEFWVWFIIALFCALGLALMLFPLILSDEKFERYLSRMSGDNEIEFVVLYIAVMLAAIPLTVIIRLIKKYLK